MSIWGKVSGAAAGLFVAGPVGALVGMIPISVRAEDEQGAMGNRVSSMLVSLASDVDDPLERLATIRNATKDAKEQDTAP